MCSKWDLGETCSFPYFHKLLNKDRVTRIPHCNLKIFPKYKDMDGEVETQNKSVTGNRKRRY